jgi:opacity protein-like surface antigen
MQSVEIRADRDQQNWRWTLGGYLKHEQETLTRRYTYLENDFNSELTVDTGAIFGQVDFTLTNTLTAYVGGRLEQRKADYADSVEVKSAFYRSSLEWAPRVLTGLHPTNKTFTSVSVGGFVPAGPTAHCCLAY